MTLQTPSSGEPGRSRVRWLAASSFSEAVGDGIARSLLPIVAVSVLGAGAGLVGVLNSLGLAAFLVLSLPVGLWADRRGRPLRLMTASSLMRAAVAGAVVALWSLGALSGVGGWMALIGLAVTVGVADVLFTTGQGLVVPGVVPKDRIRAVYGRLQASGQAGGAAAPLLLAGLLAVMAAPLAWAAAGVVYLVSVAAQQRVGALPPGRPTAPRSSAWADATGGIRHLLGIPALARVTTANALSNGGVMAANTLLPVIALTHLGVSPAVFALFAGAAALAGIGGAALANSITERLGLPRARVVVALLMAAGAASIGLALAGVTPGPPEAWLAAQSIVAGAGSSIAMVAGADLAPRLAPAERLGVVLGAQRAIVLGAMPIAALLFGAAADVLGLLPTVWAWVGITLCSTLPFLWRPAEGVWSNRG